MSTKELLERRRRTNTKPGARDDEYKLALVIEGGGMRGVISGGMTAALEMLGMRDLFDAVYGASAGAMAAAFFVAGNSAAGVTVFYDHLTTRRFVSPWRMVFGKPSMDLSFLMDDVFEKRVPLLYDWALSQPIELHVLATDVHEATAVDLSPFDSAVELKRALWAGACNPLAAGPPIYVGERPYWDAAITEAIPVATALRQGCTHFVILRTRTKDERRKKIHRFEEKLANYIMKPYGKKIYDAYRCKHVSYEKELDRIAELENRVVCIMPRASEMISQTCTDREKIKRAACEGFRVALEQFGVRPTYVGDVLGWY